MVSYGTSLSPNKWEGRNSVWLHLLPRIIMSIKEHFTLLCRARVLQQNKNAKSEMGTFRMNNAAMNETAALWHDTVKNYWHANTIPLVMGWFKLNEREFHLSSPFPLNPAQLHFNPPSLSPPSASTSLHSPNLTRDHRVIDCLIHSITTTIHNN